MTKRIFKSIFLVAAVVLLAALIIIMGVLYDYFGGVQETQLENELGLATLAVEENGVEYLRELPSSRYRLTWVSADGDVIYDTQMDYGSMDNHADRTEIQQALQNSEGKSSRYSATLLERTLYYAQRLSDGTVLRISASHATIWVLALGMLQPVLIILVLALILSGVLAGKVSRRVMEPLNQLDLEKPLENDTYEELSPLLTRINQQRRQIDRQLQEFRQKNDEFTQITRSMTEGLVLLNEKGIILSINPAAMRLFKANEECVNSNFLEIERQHDINIAIANALRSGHSEVTISRDGRVYQLAVSSIESNGKVVGAVLLTFDKTDEIQAEAKRREFTANVSHELKTPLHSICGSAELLENGLVKPEDVPRFVGHIRTEAARLVTLIEDIIRLSQLDEGVQFPMEDVDLLQIASEAVEALTKTATEKNISIRASGESTVLRGVRRLLSEIAFNLLDNAIKYNVEGGSAEILVGTNTGKAFMSVRDTGIGIPPESQPRVFERFYRVDKSHSRESGGTGLGLSIVKHAVQELGGEIELESTPGIGTTITVSIPT